MAEAEGNASPGVVRSMTGFALRRRETESGELTASLRSVNHRGLDFHFHTSQELLVFENEMRALLKKHLARGHVEVRISLARGKNAWPVVVRRDLLAGYVETLRQSAAELELGTEPDLNVLLSLPGVMEETQGPGALPPSFSKEVLGVLEECVGALDEHREREGAALRVEMVKQAEEIARWTEEIAAIRGEVMPQLAARLRAKLEELLGEAGISEQRLAEEAALLADRSDIQEELTRLAVHAEELRRILLAGGEVGKRLDFLLQELNREANTTLAKSGGAGEAGLRITNIGLGIKGNIERIREQALNLE